MALLMLGTTTVGVVVAWEHQATATEGIDRRVTALETSKGEADKHWVEVSSRLAAIETSMDWLKDQVRSKLVSDVNSEADKAAKAGRR